MGGLGDRLRRLRGHRETDAPAPAPAWVVLTHCRHQPEADLIVNLLHDAGIAAYHRRSAGFDVPDFLASGARVVLVPADALTDARAVIDPFDWSAAPGPDTPPSTPEDA